MLDLRSALEEISSSSCAGDAQKGVNGLVREKGKQGQAKREKRRAWADMASNGDDLATCRAGGQGERAFVVPFGSQRLPDRSRQRGHQLAPEIVTRGL